MFKPSLPERIICLTEESVELLYLLGEQDRIVGVSQYAVRPLQVKREKPVVSVFTHANQKKVIEMKADLIIGYSDIQKDIARDLIDQGQNVWISNHRSLAETINFCAALSALVGAQERFEGLLKKWNKTLVRGEKFAQSLGRKPKVYLEEWDEPLISGISYFSELVSLCGGIDINDHLKSGFKASARFPDEDHIFKEDPDIILACWCGKKVDKQSIRDRPGWGNVAAVKDGKIVELPPEIFLQPGPALFESGVDFLIELFNRLGNEKSGS
jgi:iron complex transport system substrate-binding protein